MKCLPRLFPRSLLVLAATLAYFGLYVVPPSLRIYDALVVEVGDLFWPKLLGMVTDFVQTYCLFFGLTLFRPLLVLAMPLVWLATGLTDYMTST